MGPRARRGRSAPDAALDTGGRSAGADRGGRRHLLLDPFPPTICPARFPIDWEDDLVRTTAAWAQENCTTSLLARFIADPPTTTQQRLKGLLTGE